MPRLISQAEFSRLAGVTEAAITKACKKQLSAARVGRRIDADHPAAKKYLEGKGARMPTVAPAAATTVSTPESKAPTKPLRSSGAKAQPNSEASAPTEDQRRPGARGTSGAGVSVVRQVVDDVASLADLTLREIGQRFGTATAFKDWLSLLKQIEDIREKRIRNEESDGRLIPRDFVRTHVFGAIEAANRRLLSDSAKTLARRIYADAKSGVTIEEAERKVRELLSSQLKPVKVQAAKRLRDGG